MKLSHRKKLAHKRAGKAKGVWGGRVIVCQAQPALGGVVLALIAAAQRPASLLSRFSRMVGASFRFLREAGRVQAGIIRGRIW